MAGFDLIVIGGGASGITAAAYAARRGRRVLLVEAGERLGGCVHTWHPLADFWVELGAHTAYNSYGALLALNGDAAFSDLIARARVGYHFFDQGRLQSPLARLSFIDAAWNLPRGLRRDKAGVDVETWFSGLLGARNWTNLLAPAFAAVLSQPAARYPASWLFRRKPRNKAAPRKFTHGEGLQAWFESLAAANGVEVRLNAPVSAVDTGAHGVRVRQGESELTAGRAVIAVPAQIAGTLLQPLLPDLATRLAATPVARIETHAVVVAAGRARLPPLAGLIGGDEAFYSAVSRDYLPHPRWRGFTFHFKPGALDAQGQRQRMAEVLDCSVEDFIHETTKLNALPVLTPASVELAAQLRQALAATPLRLVGSYLGGLSLGDLAQDASEQV